MCVCVCTSIFKSLLLFSIQGEIAVTGTSSLEIISLYMHFHYNVGDGAKFSNITSKFRITSLTYTKARSLIVHGMY